MISRFFISALWVVLAADNQTTRLKQALAAGDDGAARAALQAGADFLEEDGGESAYAVAKRYRRAALAAEMEAIRRRQVAEAFRIERAETTESRQNFLSLQRNPRGNNEIIKPETRTPAAGHVFLILDTVFWHPFPARLDGGALILMDGKNRTAAPYLPWDGYIPVNWSPVTTWNSVNGEEEEVPSDRRRILFEVRADAVNGAKLQLFGRTYAIPLP